MGGDTMSKVGSRQFWSSAITNNRAYEYYYNKLIEMALARFEWINLPDTVDERYLELALLVDGYVLFFEDEVLGYLALRSANGGMLDVYNVPEYRDVVASNGYHFRGTSENSVLIYNNYLRIPTIPEIQLFAERLANLDRTIDVNVNSQKTPVLISCNQQQEATMKNLYMKYDGNAPYIFGDKSITPESLRVIKTDSPYVAGQLYDLKEKIWNEACGALGIANISFLKRERMIKDEVNRGMGATIACRYSPLGAREQGVKKVNDMFGLDISVRFKDFDDDVGIQDEQLNDEQNQVVSVFKQLLNGGTANE